MRRSTAVDQIERIVAAADDIRGLVETGFDVTLVEVWVGGAILEPDDRVDAYDVALVLDAPVGDVPWRALHPTGAWIADRLRLTKMPVTWFVRPAGRPVLDGRLRTMVPVWSTAGPERNIIDRLRRGDVTLADVTPVDAEQLSAELAESRRHLATVLDRYHDRDWRREHTGHGSSPEDHLWRAAQAVRELTDALERRRAGDR